ncbi:MAG TPA: histidine kinase [Methylibium sp.]|uniref:sensor histidine kinase n=1 Tax=Methylibium sp. TaxID=2067992 RepID=UPI002DC04A8F|nr:histidine kinase [Methylibium sp.]HEU4458257.1 histidine kinase [Methylibium sp.]
MNPPSSFSSDFAAGWKRLAAATVRGFHAYATWLVGISWWRFALLSLLLLLAAAILSELPPFSWTISETVTEIERDESPPAPAAPPVPPAAPTPPNAPNAPKAGAATPPALPQAPAGRASEPAAQPTARVRKPGDGGNEALEIVIDKDGLRILKKPVPPQAAQQAADQAASAASAVQQAADSLAAVASQLEIKLPPGVDRESVRAAIEEAREEIRAAVEEAKQEAESAREDAESARQQAIAAAKEVAAAAGKPRTRISKVKLGDALPQIAVLWVLGSVLIKATYKGRMQAEVKAAQAAEVAESESLKRQVIEARMAAMQAQVEPHFLFNTLASIDHLIETDPKRATQMQKNLIALLRASMPTMREANAQAPRDLGRELAVIRPYLEILKVRMEERLATLIEVPEGLLSAEFPPMMVQSLVENAIKHGLEPKPEGGTLTVKADVVHGKLALSVADTGVGFARSNKAAPTAGTGVGLANIRERLALLYGARASLTVAENPGGGTLVTVTVPYKSLDDGAGARA